MPRKAHSPMKGFVSQRRHTIMQFNRHNLLWYRSSSGRPRQRAFDSPDPPPPFLDRQSVTALRRPLCPRLSLHSALSSRSVTLGRGSAVPPPGFLNIDWRSGFADSNPSWLHLLTVSLTAFHHFHCFAETGAFHHFHCFAETGEIVRSRLFSNLFPLFFRQAQS